MQASNGSQPRPFAPPRSSMCDLLHPLPPPLPFRRRDVAAYEARVREVAKANTPA